MATPFWLGTFSVAGCPPFAGVVVDDRVIAVTALQPLCVELGRPLNAPETVFGLLLDWDRNFPVLHAAVANLALSDSQSVDSIGIDYVKTFTPVGYPRQIFCAGANYRQHVIDIAVAQGHGADDPASPEERRAYAERMMDERIAAGTPYVFTKLPSTITGPYDPIVLPADTAQADWDLELGVIIGRAARHITQADALRYVAGYTIVNDMTSRDKVFRPDLKAIGSDWLLSKCSPTFLPIGPYLLPAAFVSDPGQLRITLKLNGEIMQDEGTNAMIFGVAQLIEYISRHVQLWPGDLICTGSPHGNGLHYNRFLQPGDVLEGTITRLGMQRNTCVAENA
jgi:2-keto-4-pentenoate hydratase/2-oxohepta-3-ene-1,7-dioic acid hydratase in catechol pathway